MRKMVYQEIRDRIQCYPASPELVSALDAFCKSHADVQRYAVRSSATCEDCREHAFAGEYSTFLNQPSSADALAIAVKVR